MDAIADLFQLAVQSFPVHPRPHTGGFRGEIDFGIHHPRVAAQHHFDEQGARCASHAINGEIEVTLGLVGGWVYAGFLKGRGITQIAQHGIQQRKELRFGKA